MRMGMLGLAVAMLAASQPARAEEAALAPLAPVTLPLSVALPLPVAGVLDGLVRIDTAHVMRLALRLDLGDLGRAGTTDGELPHMRRRVASAMFDYYPFGDGLRLSAGRRVEKATRLLRGAQLAGSGMLAVPIDTGRFRRVATALTVGYAQLVTQGLTLGLEGGLLREHGTAALRRLSAATGDGERGASRQPVVQFTLGYRF